MTATRTQTINRNDILRVYASFAADYRIVAEWTRLHSASYIQQTTTEIKTLAEQQYLKEVHLQLRSSSGTIREAAVYRVSTNASGWSSDRPGDLYWDSYEGDRLTLTVFYSQAWSDLTPGAREAFKAAHLPGWGPSDFDGNYGPMSSSTDRHYASQAYGLERTRYSA